MFLLRLLMTEESKCKSFPKMFSSLTFYTKPRKHTSCSSIFFNFLWGVTFGYFRKESLPHSLAMSLFAELDFKAQPVWITLPSVPQAPSIQIIQFIVPLICEKKLRKMRMIFCMIASYYACLWMCTNHPKLSCRQKTTTIYYCFSQFWGLSGFS